MGRPQKWRGLAHLVALPVCAERTGGRRQEGVQMEGGNEGGSERGSDEGEAKGTERGEREAVSLVVFE